MVIDLLRNYQPYTMQPLISIVIPIKDERDNIPPLVSRLETTLTSVDYEMILVDDGSVDGSYGVMAKTAEQNSRVRILKLDANHGKSAALAAGFNRARGDIIGTLDADLQNAPEDLPKMLKVLDGCHMVTGIRTNRQDSAIKKLSSLVANRARRLILKDDIVDIGCGLKVFRRACLSPIFHFDGMHRFLPAMFQRQGFHVKQMHVSHYPRINGRSKYGLHDRLWRGMIGLLAVCWMMNRKIEYKIVEEK